MSVQASLSLGAYDLKKSATRSLAIAFLISLFFHLFILGGNEILDIILGDSNKEEEAIVATGPVTLDDFKTEDEEAKEDQPPAEDVIPPPPPMAATTDVGSGSEGAMGNLVATENVIDGPDIADMSEIEFSDAVGGGDGSAKLADLSNISLPDEKLNIKPESAAPTQEYDMDEYIADAKYPEYDKAQLQKLIDYPTIAQENGIEGKVIVSVQVSTTGKPLQVVIRSSTNKIFEESAKKAVRKLQFTPATQGGHAIKLWLTFNVDFKLN